MILKILSNIQMIWVIFMKIKVYNLKKKWKIMIVFDNMIANMLGNKKFNPLVTEMFITGRELNIYSVNMVLFCFIKNI